MKQKIEIILEIEQTITLRRGANQLQTICPQCRTLVEMTTPRIAAALYGSSEREIFRLIEAGAIHFIETERVFVCWNSFKNDAERLTPSSGS